MNYVEENLEQVSALTLITPIKQGFVPGNPALRYADRLRGVLDGIYELVKARETPTALDRISTVHFARWVIFDDDRRLLFTSNYDGSLDSYLRDFVNDEEVAKLLDMVWENCEEYPGASAGNYQAFASWVWKHSITTNCFYAATPELTVMDVKWLRGLKNLYDELIRKVQESPGGLEPAFYEFQRKVSELDTKEWEKPSSVILPEVPELPPVHRLTATSRTRVRRAGGVS